MDTVARRPDRTLLVVIGAVAVLVVIALIVVFTRGSAPPLDASTPAGVVQRYTAAVIDGDDRAARDYLAPALREDCEQIDPGDQSGVRVTFVATTERGDTADVKVSVVTTGGGLFGQTEYQSDEVFELVREGSAWVIETAPWQFATCIEGAR